MVRPLSHSRSRLRAAHVGRNHAFASHTSKLVRCRRKLASHAQRGTGKGYYARHGAYCRSRAAASNWRRRPLLLCLAYAAGGQRKHHLGAVVLPPLLHGVRRLDAEGHSWCRGGLGRGPYESFVCAHQIWAWRARHESASRGGRGTRRSCSVCDGAANKVHVLDPVLAGRPCQPGIGCNDLLCVTVRPLPIS